MSEDTKKGSQNITDLKARLGLKKGAPGAPAPAAAAPRGVVAPPGAVPPPPGMAAPPPAPTGPQIPDASVDPFGAMSAMAQQAQVQAAPQIIVVNTNDGQPVETVHHKREYLKYMKVAGVVLVPFIVGFLLGGINYERKEIGRKIGDAALIGKDLENTGKKLQGLKEMLQIAQERGPGGKSFKLFDKELVDQLGTFKFELPEKENDAIIYRAYLFTLSPKMVEDTLMFYQRLRVLQQKVADHYRLSSDAMGRMTPDTGKAVFAPTPYGVVIREGLPADPNKGTPAVPPWVDLVELGNPICDLTKQPITPSPEGCKNQMPKGFQFRTEPDGVQWSTKTMAAGDIEKDLLYYVGPTGVLNALIKSPQVYTDELNYMSRIMEIMVLTEALNQDRISLQEKFKKIGATSKPFAL